MNVRVGLKLLYCGVIEERARESQRKDTYAVVVKLFERRNQKAGKRQKYFYLHTRENIHMELMDPNPMNIE